MSEYTPTEIAIRAIQADAWDEGMHAMAEAWGWAPSTYSGPNPYRDEADA